MAVSKRRKIHPARRRAVFDRDGLACVLCAWKPGDPSRSKSKGIYMGRRDGKDRWLPVMWMLEIDHIVPVAAGGDNSLSNLRVLCSGCNSAKGARV